MLQRAGSASSGSLCLYGSCLFSKNGFLVDASAPEVIISGRKSRLGEGFSFSVNQRSDGAVARFVPTPWSGVGEREFRLPESRRFVDDVSGYGSRRASPEGAGGRRICGS